MTGLPLPQALSFLSLSVVFSFSKSFPKRLNITLESAYFQAYLTMEPISSRKLSASPFFCHRYFFKELLLSDDIKKCLLASLLVQRTPSVILSSVPGHS